MPDDRGRTFEEIVADLARDAGFRAAFTARLEARAVDPAVIDHLIQYARDRQATMSHAMARRVLTDAGISWEAL
jgi:hypothetical protein